MSDAARPKSSLELVARMVAAIEAGDADAVRDLYSPDIVVWTNFDDRKRDRDGSLRLLGWLISLTSERRYEIMRRIEIEGGVLQQHVLHGTTPAGRRFAMPACLVISVEAGRFTRIDEYLDPAAMATAAADEGS